MTKYSHIDVLSNNSANTNVSSILSNSDVYHGLFGVAIFNQKMQSDRTYKR
ncbi:MAG: hypothetical protein V7K32_03125 [Nostoc sp.]|uniref:hypothetical protein n=1 Tax=Nostoc sp. TaxID=1180 RepID=UPI002FFAC1A3